MQTNLTREQIAALEPGRETDMLVAKAMGCNVCEKLIGYAATSYPQYDIEPYGDYWICECEDGRHGDSDSPGDPDAFRWIKHYSTDIAAALLVLGRAYTWSIAKETSGAHEVIFTIRIDGERETHISYDMKIELAICRAALMAVSHA